MLRTNLLKNPKFKSSSNYVQTSFLQCSNYVQRHKFEKKKTAHTILDIIYHPKQSFQQEWCE